jgi:hypothetical protein
MPARQAGGQAGRAEHRQEHQAALKAMRSLTLFFFALVFATNPALAAAMETHRYDADGQTYTYSVQPTGENYTFEFDKSPGTESRQLRAVGAVFKTVYEDESIAPLYHQAFMKEGARCFVFPANFYSYTDRFLPNDYAPEQRERFWGFVSRLPNAAWLITRNLLPALLVLGVFFVCLRKRQPE